MSNFIEKLKKARDPRKVLLFLLTHYGTGLWRDDIYLKIIYYIFMGKRLNLDNPQTFNEKLQWLKLHDRRPAYTQMVDKYAAKQYVAERIGAEYIIPTLGVWDSVDAIDFDSLPDQFVLKCTHDSGGVVICRDKSTFDRRAAKRKIEQHLKKDYFLPYREWPYKDVPRRIIAEQYLVDESGYELKDYKVFNFNGKAQIIQVHYGRFVQHMCNLYSPLWEFIEATINYPNDPQHQIPRPAKLEEMLTLAEKLSAGIPHVRTDFYSIGDKLYFGELTFYHSTGLGKFIPSEFGITMGNLITLPQGGVIIKGDGYILWLHGGLHPKDLTDYKVFVFNGEPRLVEVDYDRFTRHKLNIYDLDWNYVDYYFTSHNDPTVVIPRPKRLDDMLNIARTISRGIDFLRVDFYSMGNRIYVGELTFHPGSGFIDIHPQEMDLEMGRWLKLSNLKNRDRQ